MTVTQQIITIAITAIATIITRFLPFAVFQSNKRQTPKFIEYLGKALPAAVFAMLVVYCLKRYSHRKSRFAGTDSDYSSRSSPPLEEADASFDCRRHGLLYAPCSVRV